MFWYYHKKPKKGVVYNAGGGIKNSISILEAISQINSICKQKVKGWEDWTDFEVTDNNRKGDHIYYVTNFDKFKNDYPEWPGITISLKSLIGQMVEDEIKKNKK
jgi:CDP-paratose 2-epimerase